MKSRNVLVGENNEIKLADFGLAKIKSETVTSSSKVEIKGTAAFMAPELLTQEKNSADKATDIYSLGMLFWEIATGEEPFKHAANIIVIITSLLQEKRPDIPKETPISYATLIQRCWQQRSEERPKIEEVQKFIADAHTQYKK